MMCHRLYSTNIPSHSGIKLSISESLKKLEAEEASNMQSATEATPIGNMKIISNEDTSFSPHRVDLLSGMPQEMKKRSVRIYKPAKSATQSGVEKTTKWRMDFDITNKWQNPLMGWTSS